MILRIAYFVLFVLTLHCNMFSFIKITLVNKVKNNITLWTLVNMTGQVANWFAHITYKT